MMDELDTQCAPIEACLPLMAGGELEPALAEQVQAHLARCPRCHASLRALESALSQLAKERARVDPQVNLWPALERELVATGRIVAIPAARSHERLQLELAASALQAPPAHRQAFAHQASGSTLARTSGRASWLGRAAFLAAAAGLAIVAWRWSSSPAPQIDAPGVQRDVAALSDSPVGASQTVESSTSSGAVALVSDEPAGVHSGVENAEERLAAGPLSVPVGAGAAGLRRLGVEEPLLRDSIDPHGAGGDYSLAGSRGLR